MKEIQVRMLGGLSLQYGENRIDDAGNRSKKVWSLLAYLICNRGRSANAQKLIDLLWGDDAGANPENALRITLHRLRAQLDLLWPGAGRELILYKDSGYSWNPDFPIQLDCERFERLCQQQNPDMDARLADNLEAIALYKGEFLPRQTSDMWVVPIGAHLQNLYLTTVLETASLLLDRSRNAEAADICRKAAETEPYHEFLHQLLMRALAAAGDQKAAAAVYDQLNRRLFDDFGIRPSEQTREVYRACAHSPEDRTLPIDEVLEYLQEPDDNAGAMECDYDYFKILCHAERRTMERSGHATHIALLSISGGDKPLTRRTQQRIMEQFGQTLKLNLRRGDTISRCSVSQYIIMLPKANYEDSCMVCRRILAAYHRIHPHVSAQIHYMVQPLTPSICVP